MRSATLFSDKRREISVDRETVGPRHDPYGRETLTVRDKWDNKSYQFVSCGLAGYSVVTVFGDFCAAKQEFGENGTAAMAEFANLTGYPPISWQRFAQEAKMRGCTEGGRHMLDSVSGFPGETLYQCVKCKRIMASSMNFEAIE